jgi:hypothetical protein
MKMIKLTDFELGYLAGFIDGEGALIINKREHIGYKGIRYVGYSAYIDLGNTNKECLEYIKNLLNVTSGIYTNQCKGNRKVAYRLRIGYKQAKPLIEQLQDRLIIKKNIAKVFLEYDQTDDKESLWQSAKQLNKRGIF